MVYGDENAVKGCLGKVIQDYEKMVQVSKMSLTQCQLAEMCSIPNGNPYLKCPRWFMKKFADYKGNFWGTMPDSPSKMCNMDTESGFEKNISAAALESALAKSPQTSLGANKEMLSSCFLPDKTNEYSAKERRVLTAQYYQQMNRLKQATLSSLESMAAIDEFINEDFLGPSDCEDPRIIQTRIWCERLRNCNTPQQKKEKAQMLRDETFFAMQMIRDLEQNRGHCAKNPDHKDDPGICHEAIDQQIEMIKSTYPLTDGSIFKKSMEGRPVDKVSISNALNEQLKVNKKELLETLSDYKKATACLNAEVDDCDVDLDKIIASTPSVPRLAVNGPVTADERKNAMAINSAFDDVTCLEEINVQKGIADDALKSFLVNSALTVATMGLGSLASGAKATITAAKTGVGTARALNQARALASVIKTPSGLVYVALAGYNAKFTYDLVESAVETCSPSDELSIDLKASSNLQNGPRCGADSDMGKTRETFRMKSCLCAAALAGTNLLPYVGPAVKSQIEKYLGPSMRKYLTAPITKVTKSTVAQVSVGAIGFAEQKLLESKLGQLLVKTNKLLKTDVKDLAAGVLKRDNAAVASADAALVGNLVEAEKELGKKSMDEMADVIEGMSNETRDDFIEILKNSTPKHTPELIEKALLSEAKCKMKLAKSEGKSEEELEKIKNECLALAIKALK
jgi:hypothetical protein